MRSHKYCSKKDIPDQLIDKKIKQYGWDNFDKLIIASAYNKEHLDELEIYYIDYYKTQVQCGNGYNIKEGGSNGGKYSEEIRKRMSINRKGKSPSIETRAKLSEAGKGRIVSEETRQKMSITNTGRKASDEAKKNMSEAHLGEKNQNFGKRGPDAPAFGSKRTPEDRAKMSRNNPKLQPIQCIETQECFHGQRECCRKMGLSIGSLSEHLDGKRPAVKGFHFKRINKKDKK